MTAVCAEAQTLVGFQGYYTQAKLSTDTTKLNRMQTYESGYGGGISVKHFELGPLGLQAELNYEKSGFGFHNDTTNQENPIEMDYRQELTYVQLATLMQVDIGKHTVHFIGALGPYLNVLLSAPKPETTMETVMQNGFSKMFNADYNRFTYGLMGEAGIAFATKIGVFQITGRANIGMSKLLHFKGVSLFNYTLPKSYGAGINYYIPFGEEKYKKDRIEEDTIVSDLEILSDSLNAVSDTVSVKASDKTSKKDKKVKEKKNKKSKNEEPVVTESEQPVSNESEQPVSDENKSVTEETEQSVSEEKEQSVSDENQQTQPEESENKLDNDNNGTE